MNIFDVLKKIFSKLKSELAFCKDKESEYQKFLSQKDEIIDDLKNMIIDSNQSETILIFFIF